MKVNGWRERHYLKKMTEDPSRVPDGKNSRSVLLLLLWDELNIPHEEKKQIYGPIVAFVGFEVDPNAMTIFISDER